MPTRSAALHIHMSRPPGAPVAVALVCVSLALGLAAPLIACDTPVYEYALLHWSQDVYTVYYLHDGAKAPGDSEANALLKKAARGGEGHANLEFAEVDARDPESLAPEARRVLSMCGEAARPRHVVVSPKGRVLSSGRLSVGDARDLLDSPKTAALADLLAGGAQGALVLLTDDDEARNQQARETVQSVVEAAKGMGRRVGMLEVSRQDAPERWLTRQLLAVEADLAQLRGPMVFGAYGRCHVTEAYVGKGINAANLTNLVEFMNGPCTCLIRAANADVDLISGHDWGTPVPGLAPDARLMDPGGYITFGDE